MKKSKRATSIIEVIVLILIIVLWITWIYKIYSESIILNNSIENKITAIQIAREWIEAVTNIRDTNWLVLSSNIENCWKSINYNTSCLTWAPTNILHNNSYRVERDGSNRWILTSPSSTFSPNNYSNTDYRNFYRVYTDINWLYTHDDNINNKLNNIYTREIVTSYINSITWNISATSTNWLRVRSIVRWTDLSGIEWWVVHEIVLETILTNYKK
jgi:type II secretory pathway pseudopilin PulG